MPNQRSDSGAAVLDPPRTSGMTLTDEQVHQLSKLVGLNVTTPEALIDRVRMMSQISVNGVPVTLEPGLITRLRSRCLDKSRFPEYVAGEVKRLLHGAVGW